MKLIIALLLTVVGIQAQTVLQYKDTIGGGTTATVVFATAPGVGDLLVCGAITGSLNTPITNGYGVWHDFSGAVGTLRFITYFEHTVVFGEPNSFSFTDSAGAGRAGCFDLQVNPVAGLIVHEDIQTVAVARTITAGPITPSKNNATALVFNFYLGTNTPKPTVTAGWTVPSTSGSSSDLWVAYMVVPTPVSTSATFTNIPANNVGMTADIVTVQIASGIAGAMRYGNSVGITGMASITLPGQNVNNVCSTPAKVVTGFTTSTQVVAGVFTPVQLFPSPCLSLGPSLAAKSTLLPGAGTAATGTAFGQYTGKVTVVAGSSAQPNASIVKVGLTIMPQLNCYVLPAEPNALAANAKLVNTTVTRTSTAQVSRYLTITSTTALTAGLTYQWTWQCIPPYLVSVADRTGAVLYAGKWLVPIPVASEFTDITLVDTTQIGALPQ